MITGKLMVSRCRWPRGLLRPDLGPEDLTPVPAMLDAGLEAIPVNADPEVVGRRLIAVLLDGLFARPAEGRPAQDEPVTSVDGT
jgi:hypothetical protein